VTTKLSGKVGVWSLINSFDVLLALLNSQPDFVIFDFEHGNWRNDQLTTAIKICKLHGATSIVRIGTPSISNFQLAFDSSADFVQVSGITENSDLQLLQNNSLTGPHGKIGYSPWTSVATTTTSISDFEIDVILQIENKDMLNDFLSSNMAIPNCVKMIFIGRYDLSISLGLPGQIENQVIIEALEQSVKMCKEKGLGLSTISVSDHDFNFLRSIGVETISYKSDIMFLRNGLSILKGMK
jgi:4-hydroxy-2-oxoheptanedioate aldolase